MPFVAEPYRSGGGGNFLVAEARPFVSVASGQFSQAVSRKLRRQVNMQGGSVVEASTDEVVASAESVDEFGEGSPRSAHVSPKSSENSRISLGLHIFIAKSCRAYIRGLSLFRAFGCVSISRGPVRVGTSMCACTRQL